MTTLREAAQHALEALTVGVCDFWCDWDPRVGKVIDDLRQALEAEQQDEPVAWQCRTRPDWDSKVGWSAWESCAKERAQEYWKHPALHNWQYEARALYTRPQPRQPLTDEMVELGWELHGSSDAYQAWSLAVEWTERAHGIGGEA